MTISLQTNVGMPEWGFVLTPLIGPPASSISTTCQWDLDDRPHGNGDEINPDVLGYIFEKYVNQKQMGAYYTKEDITGYIARNTVIPRLLEMAQAECLTAFAPEGGVWRLLQDDPDNYIYPSVGHGVAWDYAAESIARLDQPLELPDNIAAGLDDTAKRGQWNQAAPAGYALPTETWRELTARRQRYEEVRGKLAAGEVQSVNDLTTLNLDSERFARDVIVNSEGPELVRAVWNALTRISVLDPACGSGAFLFAALNILEPLYSAALQAMRGFVADLETHASKLVRPRSPNALRDFRQIHADAAKHRSERYYILKSIIVNNLYGVDIMAEAVEICRLRLFLKLAAQLESYGQIEPLPDIDFNIQPGNSLVGFTSLDAVRRAMTVTADGKQFRALDEEQRKTLEQIEADAAAASQVFDHFRQHQIALEGETAAIIKEHLKESLARLKAQLDGYLAAEYGIDPADKAAYPGWQTSHQPFHWFVEFHGVMTSGGFDVVIGNPPYVEYSKVKSEYTIKHFETESCGNLYAFVMEQCKILANQRGAVSMIVPLSGHSTQRMQPLVENFYQYYDSCHLFNISADANPSVLFTGVKFRLAIFIVSNYGKGIFTTGYSRWYAEERDRVFDLVAYTDIEELRYKTAIPKVSDQLHLQVLRKMFNADWQLQHTLQFKDSSTRPVFYHSTPVNWIRSHSAAPYFRSDRDGVKAPNGLNTLEPTPEAFRNIQSILSSTSFFVWWLALSDCYHLNRPEVLTFPMCQDEALQALSQELEQDMQAKSKRRVYHYKATGKVEYDEFYLKQSKPIIDEIDRVLAEHYGLTDEELDFIINYDIGSELRAMPKTLHIRTTVQPGGKVEFASPELEAGQTVDVVVTPSEPTPRRQALDILNGGPDKRLFKNAEEVKEYLAEEKASWDR